VLFEEGQSRIRVYLGPIMVVVVCGGLVVEEAEVEVVVRSCADTVVLVFEITSLLLAEFERDFDARLPPTPPPTAPPITTAITIAVIQNAFVERPQMRLGLGGEHSLEGMKSGVIAS